MNTSKTFMLLAISAGILLMGCKGTGTKKEILYNDYTGTDTDAFIFLKESYHQASYQQFAAKSMTNKTLAADISKTYADVAQKLTEIGVYDNVIIPALNEVPFEDLSDTLATTENSVVDSLSTVATLANSSPKTESWQEKIVSSQEKIIHQFENASENTNVRIRHYAQETLPKLEDLLARTKSELN